MKIVLFQPPYPTDGTISSAEECLRWLQAELERLTSGEQDVVLLPEYANAPGWAIVSWAMSNDVACCCI